MSLAAIGPCPCPSEIDLIFLPKPLASANLSSSVIGSCPGESTKTIGAMVDESS